MARKYHPDLNPNDKQAEIKFKEQNEVLSNPENRKNTINTAKTGNRVQNMKKKQESNKVNTKVANSKPTLMVLKVMIILIFLNLCLQVKVAEQELQAIKDKILTLNYI
jgi:hypothetical protein